MPALVAPPRDERLKGDRPRALALLLFLFRRRCVPMHVRAMTICAGSCYRDREPLATFPMPGNLFRNNCELRKDRNYRIDNEAFVPPRRPQMTGCELQWAQFKHCISHDIYWACVAVPTPPPPAAPPTRRRPAPRVSQSTMQRLSRKRVPRETRALFMRPALKWDSTLIAKVKSRQATGMNNESRCLGRPLNTHTSLF
jgi:hypothetical protein